MIRLRITKYDPSLRNSAGHYLGDDWTSVCDIGKTFGGKLLTASDYLAAEDAYVAALRELLSSAQIQHLQVVDYGGRFENVTDSPIAEPDLQARSISEGAMVLGKEIDDTVRLALRERIWCRLVGIDGTYVHFGYDFYMYFGTDSRHAKLVSPPAGIYFERQTSPYDQT